MPEQPRLFAAPVHVPEAQGLQMALVPPTVPSMQLLQDVPSRYAASMKPEGQALHDNAPVAEKASTEQGEHPVAPLEEAYVPGAHGRHTEPGVAE